VVCSVLYPFQRLLNLYGFVVIVLLGLFSGNVQAVYEQDSHSMSADALTHCTSSATSAGALFVSNVGGNWSAVPQACEHFSVAKYYFCKFSARLNGVHQFYRNCNQPLSGSGTAGPYYRQHVYTTVSPACEADVNDQITSYWGSLHGSLEAPASVCLDNCNYNYVVGPSLGCQNLVSDPNQWECGSTYAHDGEECQSNTSEESGIVPGDPNYYDCTNVDCSSDPSPGGGSGESGDVPDVDPQNPGTGSSGGDGNSATPNQGTGSGNTGGGTGADGTGADCDPSSNPDCAYAGSGTGSGSCDVQPVCTGDPVQCAILYQEWASMCYDGGEFTNPSDCQIALTCEGDVLLCEMIRQERQQYCDAYVGDGSTDLDPTNNVDFDRDLKDEAEIVELPDGFNSAGLGAGSCPADIPLNLSFGSVNVSFATACSMAPIIRLFVILSATLGAVFIVIGGGRTKGVV
jgi:hypothetical protein